MLKIGDRIIDNDPRVTRDKRILVIEKIEGERVVCRDEYFKTFPVVKILIRRIHTDGKRRRSGFNLLSS